MQKELPFSFDFTENDLDIHFIGQWNVNKIDDYGTVKAGTTSRCVVVRSQIDLDKDIIKLISYVPTKNGVTDIVLDGTFGLSGKISERSTGSKEGELTRVDFLHINLLKSNKIAKEYSKTKEGYRLWKTSAEIDDIVFNHDKTYSYPFYYIGTDTVSSKLIGMYVEIPIDHFNHYVKMRDLWFREYKGSKQICKLE
jgi:hypothetical protein